MAKLDLSKCPVLRGPRRRWTADDVRVAADWALEHGYDRAEDWMISLDRGFLQPAVAQATIAGGVDPLDAPAPFLDILRHFDYSISYEDAQSVFRLMNGTVDPLEFKSVKKWISAYGHRPHRAEMVMQALNEVLGGHGVEAIRVEGAWVDTYHHDIVATYVNMGDTYAATVVYDTDHDRFELSTWGDFVERREREQQEDPLIHEWNIGYDLDGGGYSFEYADPPVVAAVAEANMARVISEYVLLSWDQPDLDYVTSGDVVPGGYRRATADLLLIVPNGGQEAEWPPTIRENNDDETELHLIAEGVLFETDHDCSWCGAGTGTEPSPDPNCQRCDGDGYVNSPGGAYGIYERREVEEEPPRRPDETLHYR